MPRLAALMLLLPMSACTAGFATVRLMDAGRAVRIAEEAGSEANAPYEHTLAVQHYRKAVEEHSDSEYKASVEMAKLAKMWAEQAKIVAEGGTRSIQGFEKAGEDLSDTKDLEAPKPKPEEPPIDPDAEPTDEPEEEPVPPPSEPKKKDDLEDEDFLDKEDE